MNFITSQFENFTLELYISLTLIIVCFFWSCSNPIKGIRGNSPLWTILISFFAFSKFDISDYYIDRISFGISALLLIWYFYIKFLENEENNDRDFRRGGKESISNGVNSAKNIVRGKVNDTVGSGIFGSIANIFMNEAESRIDNKVGGFLGGFFGTTNEFTHEDREAIDAFRILLFLGMIISIFCLR
jgi:hypothetical protein